MATYLPRKLATTIGCELTFVPAMFQEIHEATGVETWDDYDEINVRSYLSRMMKKALEKEGIPYYKCTTDPYVVEVCTDKTNSAATFRKTVKAYHRIANGMNMFSNASYTKGGGAHVHAGIPNIPNFIPLMAHFAVTNPWMTFAFANPRDHFNAQPYHRDSFNQPTYRQRQVSRADIISQVRHAVEMEAQYQRSLINITEEYLHHVKYQKDGSANTRRNFEWRNVYWGEDDVVYARCRVMEWKKKVAKYLKDYAKYDIARYPTTKVEAKPQKGKALADIHMPEAKGYAISYREVYGTMEFRSFLMPETWHGHVKQVALVDAIVRHINKQAEQGMTYVDDTLWPTMADLKTMPYSTMVKGFNAMLTMLDFDPADFREERVNMAIRKRFMRNNKEAVAV